jgi:hypothetical protein
VGAGRLPFWVDLIFKSAFQKNEQQPATRKGGRVPVGLFDRKITF